MIDCELRYIEHLQCYKCHKHAIWFMRIKQLFALICVNNKCKVPQLECNGKTALCHCGGTFVKTESLSKIGTTNFELMEQSHKPSPVWNVRDAVVSYICESCNQEYHLYSDKNGIFTDVR